MVAGERVGEELDWDELARFRVWVNTLLGLGWSADLNGFDLVGLKKFTLNFYQNFIKKFFFITIIKMIKFIE